ncbi:MAG: hypothetical protein CHACPFDD_00195 [Phycisphaerae bacterium]|nr:hypothetical protein [Phycisphaerae bacterium]
MTSRSRESRTGFTLIELLVVVAIMALLISILLPSLNGARQQAKQLLCVTNLRSQGQASYFYAEQNRDTIARGETPRLHFSTVMLQGLGYDGSILGLYRSARGQAAYAEVLRKIPQFQCPTFPVALQPLDYVVNAFPLPYTQNNISRDAAGGGQAGDDSRSEGGWDNIQWFKTTNFGRVSPSKIVYTIEAHHSLAVTDFQLHDTFYASQLPFGAYPRMSNDKRHPGGINALFFDGSSRNLKFPELDAGWPNSLGIRLRWFTIMPEGYE